MNLLLATSDGSGLLTCIRWCLLIAARSAAVRLFDPIVSYEFYGRTIRIPLSHDLPLYRRTYPLYSDNLGRIAAHISKKYNEFSVIDIGANVGDSVAIVRHYTQAPILCIEGEPRFVGLLAENTCESSPVATIEACFIAGEQEELKAIVHEGTAKLTHASTAGVDSIPCKTLERILVEHPQFGNAKLLKIDTDGMDMAILGKALSWLTKQKPVLFFEYDPDLQREHRADGLIVLNKLKQAGYRQVLVYENTGDYMLSLELANEDLLSELHHFYSGRHSKRYCDLCVFHAEDSDIAQSLRGSELVFFQSSRQY